MPSHYFVVVNEDLYKGSVAVVVALGLCAVAIYALKKGKFAKFSSVDTVVLCMAIAVGIFWQISSNDRTTNLLLQVILFIPFFQLLLDCFATSFGKKRLFGI